MTHKIRRVRNHAYSNAESVWALLRLRAAAGLPRPITPVLDNAPYQRCGLVQALARALESELLYLPSYPPNCNRLERVWEFVKKDGLAARVQGADEQFTAASDECLAQLSDEHKAQMDTPLALDFQSFDNVSVLSA